MQSALRKWRFKAEDMLAKPIQRLAAQLYMEFFDLLIMLTVQMLVGTLVLTPINWYEGTNHKSSESFFERSYCPQHLCSTV